MSKRNYFIIIAILVAVDIATAFWYLAGHINSDGKNDFFSAGSELATEADTLNENFVPDKYQTIEYNAFFVSKAPVIPSDQRTYYTSIKRLKTNIPTTINGETNTDRLLAEVARKAFPNSHGGLDNGVQNFLKSPAFNVPNVDYKVINSAPTIFAKYGNVQGVKIYPIFTSKNYLVMAINRSSYKGVVTQNTAYYVNYNRYSHSIISKEDIFINDVDNKLLSIVNDKIEKLNENQPNLELHQANTLSQEIYLRKNGLFFVYQAGAIANEEEGVIEIYIPFSTLNPYLKPEFSSLITTNSHCQELKPLAFAK